MIEKARMEKRQERNSKIKSLYNEMVSSGGQAISNGANRYKKKGAAANDFLGFKVD